MSDRGRLLRKINAALDMHGALLTIDDLTELAQAHRVRLFHRNNTMCAAELISYPRGLVCNCLLAAGDLADVLALEPEVEEFARSHGAASMVTHGRRGWARIGARTGWRERSTEYVKSLPTRGEP